ncbi:Uncharacterised protein [Vibrio cholerae]|nr:Uncharacterised protein [Vibrio cholerae]
MQTHHCSENRVLSSLLRWFRHPATTALAFVLALVLVYPIRSLFQLRDGEGL